MRKDKEVAFNLRKQGKSYNQIRGSLGVSKSTLTEWFKNEEWSRHLKRKNINKQVALSKERLIALNNGRKLRLDNLYLKFENEAKLEYELHKNNPLFVAGLMLYAGEGDRLDKGTIRIANIDFKIHRIFINFAKEFLGIDHSSIKLSILLYPDLNIENCVNVWCKELSISQENVYKPQVIKGKLKSRKLHFGVGTTIILSSFLKHKLLYWIDRSKSDLSI